MDIRDLWDVVYLHRRRVIPIVAAVGLAVVTFVAFRSLVAGGDPVAAPPPAAPPVVAEAPPPTEPEPEPEPVPPPAVAEAAVPEPLAMTPTLLVAKQAIEAGDVLGGELVEWRAWEDPIDLSTAILHDAESANQVPGSIARVGFPAGTPITQAGIILRGGPGFIGGVLGPDMRAVTVEVDGATTRAGLIHPGDQVDVILVSTGAETLAQTIVRDVRVLAVGSALVAGDISSVAVGIGGLPGIGAMAGLGDALGAGALDGALDGLTGPPLGDTYTLEVSAADADRVALAANVGQLMLAMRGAASSASDGPAPMSVGLADVITRPRDLAPPPVRIIRGVGSATAAPPPSPASLLGS